MHRRIWVWADLIVVSRSFKLPPGFLFYRFHWQTSPTLAFDIHKKLNSTDNKRLDVPELYRSRALRQVTACTAPFPSYSPTDLPQMSNVPLCYFCNELPSFRNENGSYSAYCCKSHMLRDVKEHPEDACQVRKMIRRLQIYWFINLIPLVLWSETTIYREWNDLSILRKDGGTKETLQIPTADFILLTSARN